MRPRFPRSSSLLPCVTVAYCNHSSPRPTLRILPHMSRRVSIFHSPTISKARLRSKDVLAKSYKMPDNIVNDISALDEKFQKFVVSRTRRPDGVIITTFTWAKKLVVSRIREFPMEIRTLIWEFYFQLPPLFEEFGIHRVDSLIVALRGDPCLYNEVLDVYFAGHSYSLTHVSVRSFKMLKDERIMSIRHLKIRHVDVFFF